MAFDDKNRNLLQKMVDSCRRLLSAEFTKQLQELYGIQPGTGSVIDLSEMTHLTDDQCSIASLLRDRIDHLASGLTEEKNPVGSAIDRVIREQAFTILNRFAALRMSEEREIVRECVRNGMQSQGFQVYLQIAGSSLGDTYQRYMVFLGCLFDELAIDLGTLFDRYSPLGLLFPREQALNELLKVINDLQLKDLWKEDETIGWVYQYFNTKEEREAMRKASQAPRNSRELAVRNQFFTPRYVVEFLTDNTLGRIWYEMTKGNTSLKDNCRYLVRRPNEIFLSDGEDAPNDPTLEKGGEGGFPEKSQEELLKEPVYIPHRPIKDPREIRMLDPACGSMHFGLYSFDLFEVIYEEAWDNFPKFLSDIREQIPNKEDFMKLVPEMIIRHNIHGIDIDPRAAQIAELSLWLRAQKSYQRLKIKAPDRPRITKSNIVCAEPMPGEKEMLEEFIAKLKPAVLGDLVREVWNKMQLAGEAGSLLKIEEELSTAIEKAKEEWVRYKAGDFDVDPVLFKEMEQPVQGKMRFDVTGVQKKEFWDQAETLVLSALREFAESATNGHGYQRKLFAEDAVHGFAFIDLCRKKFDVVLMNPPFGEFSLQWKKAAIDSFPYSYNDILASFVDRFLYRLVPSGRLGAITSRTCFFLSSFQKWREHVILDKSMPIVFADLGHGIMDAAMVEAAAYVLQNTTSINSTLQLACIRLFGNQNKALALGNLTQLMRDGKLNNTISLVIPAKFRAIPGTPLAYWIKDKAYQKFQQFPSFSSNGRTVKQGLATADDFRFVRTTWEIPLGERNRRWIPFAKGGAYSQYYADIHLAVNWDNVGAEIKNNVNSDGKVRSNVWMLQDTETFCFFHPGLTWSLRTTSGLSLRAMPENCIFGHKGPAAFVKNNNPDEILMLLGLANSTVFKYFVNLQMAAADAAARSYEVGVIKSIPVPIFSSDDIVELAAKVLSIWSLNRTYDTTNEISNAFFLPLLLQGIGITLSERATSWGIQRQAINEQIITLRREIDDLSFVLYGIEEKSIIMEDNSVIESYEESNVKDDEIVANASIDVHGLVSWMLGAIYGRFDVRCATADEISHDIPKPFAPLPICSSGMLQNSEGLPADKKNVPTNYPLSIIWDGILVDDPENQYDSINRIREVLEVLWEERADAIEQEACKILRIKTLRDYFRKPSGFFTDHLKRYSKSRRQAPIYWPLSTTSGSYTLWIYYHRLTDQTLYKCINDFVNPKIDDVSRGIEKLQSEIARGGNSKQKEELADQMDFLQELKDFRDELLRVAQLPYKPNLNDGVLITASPLHNLFGLPKWKKDLEECWEKLHAGEYDWAHLAYTIWPDRVKEVCKKDRSIAIAHGLEDLCEIKAPEKKAKKKKSVEDKPATGKRGKKKNAGDDALAKMGLEF